jgi:hypothetical protein
MMNVSSNATLSNVTFDGNSSAYGYGGGVVNGTSNATFTNVTFSGNSVASGYGGGMFNFGGSPVLNNVTFSGNTAYYSGGALYNHSSAHPTISNTIFWGNSPQEIINDSNNGAVTVIIKDSVVLGGCPVNTSICANIITADPNLDVLADNGGLTQTIALFPGSSAIDAGGKISGCAVSDQRGISRPQGAGCDIGAFELVPTLLVNSVLPTSRSMTVGIPATVFSTVINAGTNTAQGIVLAMAVTWPGVPAVNFTYSQTDCTTNAVVGPPDPVLDLPAGGMLCYVVSFTPLAAFDTTTAQIYARADNATATTRFPGVNTVELRATSSGGPDIIAVSTTTDFHQFPSNGANAFAVALSNVGANATGDITVTANTGGVALPINITVMETDPPTGAVIGDNILQNVAAGENRTVAVFVTFHGPVSFNPALNRIFIRFLDENGDLVGSTSTAVSTGR